MPQVKVTHDSLTDEGAKDAPKREPVPQGDYIASIAAAPLGLTKSAPPLQKISVEFHILYACTEPKDTTQEGRHVYQDYILEKDPRQPDMTQQRRRELRMLLDAHELHHGTAAFAQRHGDGLSTRRAAGEVDAGDRGVLHRGTLSRRQRHHPRRDAQRAGHTQAAVALAEQPPADQIGRAHV